MSYTANDYTVLDQVGGVQYRRLEFNGSSYPAHALVEADQNEDLQIVGQSNPLSTKLFVLDLDEYGYSTGYAEVSKNNPMPSVLHQSIDEDNFDPVNSSNPLSVLIQDHNLSEENPIPVSMASSERLGDQTTATSGFTFSSLVEAVIFNQNFNRAGFMIHNRGPGTLFLGFFDFDTDELNHTNYVVALGPNETYKDTFLFTGNVKGFFGSAGNARCQEFLRANAVEDVVLPVFE